MTESAGIRPRDIDWFSAMSHLLGACLSIAGLVVLVVFAALEGKVWHVVSFSIFGASLILLYTASTLYHWLPKSVSFRQICRRIDHSMIYLLIAGTYTPVCLVALRGPWGWSLFGVIWVLAVWGIVMKAAWFKIPRIVSSLSYIIMGWLAIMAFIPLTRTIGFGGILWLIIGGIFYSVGTIFYGIDKKHPSASWFNWHDLFHLFILGGSISHFWVMFRYLLPIR